MTNEFQNLWLHADQRAKDAAARRDLYKSYLHDINEILERVEPEGVRLEAVRQVIQEALAV